MKSGLTKAFLFALYLSVCATAFGQSPDDFFPKFLAVLNGGKHEEIAAFVTDRFAPSADQDGRIKKLENIAKQVGPFTLLKSKTGTASLKALANNGDGQPVTFLASLSPEGKVLGIRLNLGDDYDAPEAKDYSEWKDLASLTSEIRTDTKSPAAAVAMIRNGRLSQAVSGERTLGKSDAAQVDDVWSIGSIGKPICSTVIGRLIEMGKLRWDTTLGEALPGFKMREDYKVVTLEQLMHHRGGVPPDLGFRKPDIERIASAATDPMQIRKKYALDILSRELIAKPGEKFAYSNGGYALLGVVAEQTMHKPYESLVKELVFEPLGLKHSFTNADRLPDKRPSGHIPGPNGLHPENMSGQIEVIFAPAGGGMYMSVADLATFGAAHLKGLRGEDGLLKAATVQRLHRALPADGLDYACGWGIESFQGIEKSHGHNGSNGAFTAQICIFPKANLVVAAFVNCGGESDPSPPLQAALAIAGRYAREQG